MSIPDANLAQRIATLERRLNEAEMRLDRPVEESRLMLPLNARLWVAQLNEDLGATTALHADADLCDLEKVDTNLDVDIYDPLDIFSDFLDADDYCYVLEQINITGDRYFIIIQAPC